MSNGNEPRAGRRFAVWAALSLGCCALGYCSLFAWYPGSVASYGVDFRRALTWELLRWNLWLPVAALILRWNRAVRLHGAHALAVHAASALLFPALHIALLLAAYFPFSPAGLVALLRHRAYVLIPDYLTGIVICGLVLGLAHAWREQARAAQLETQLAQAQLEALKMQLHPHFLFNTLNAVAALQLEDPETARRMLVRLSDFLRATLENAGVHEVSLEREVDFVSRYLEIERVRFPKKLAVEIRIDPGTRDALVPNLILQPIVENAIRHGIAAKACAGRVEIHARRRNGSLQLRVRDTGPGMNGANPQALHLVGGGRNGRGHDGSGQSGYGHNDGGQNGRGHNLSSGHSGDGHNGGGYSGGHSGGHNLGGGHDGSGHNLSGGQGGDGHNGGYCGGHNGRGLAITRALLERMYGPAARLSLRNAPGGGLEVEIEIPFATAPGQADGTANGAHA